MNAGQFITLCVVILLYVYIASTWLDQRIAKRLENDRQRAYLDLDSIRGHLRAIERDCGTIKRDRGTNNTLTLNASLPDSERDAACLEDFGRTFDDQIMWMFHYGKRIEEALIANGFDKTVLQFNAENVIAALILGVKDK